VVFDTRLFAGGKPPKTITVSCNLVAPVAKEQKARQAAKVENASKEA
jgi:hypothetical protein